MYWLNKIVKLINATTLIVIAGYALTFTPLYQEMDDHIGLPLHELYIVVTTGANA